MGRGAWERRGADKGVVYVREVLVSGRACWGDMLGIEY